MFFAVKMQHFYDQALPLSQESVDVNNKAPSTTTQAETEAGAK